jgi:hypothetical protein
MHFGSTREPDDDSMIFAALCSASATERQAAAAALTDLLEEKHSTEHHRRVGELIASAEPNERAGGLAAIGSLIQLDGDDLGPRLSTYGPPLRTALQRSVGSSLEVVGQVCEYYRELVRRARDPEALEAEARWSLGALSEDGEASSLLSGDGGIGVSAEVRLLTGVLTLRQLTLQAPTAVYPHAAAALEQLWRPLTFHAPQVRAAAADALLALVVVVAPRATRYLTQWHTQLLAGARAALDRDSSASCHGGLLALSCLLRVATVDFVFQEDSFEASARLVGVGGGKAAGAAAPTCFSIAWAAASRHLSNRKHPALTRTALQLVINLVQVAPDVFAGRCLPDCVRVLGEMLRDQRCRLRSEAFSAHAAIVSTLGASYVRPHVPVLLSSLRESLIRGTRSRLFCLEALRALSAIASTFGEEVALQLQPLVAPLLTLPLSPELLEALHALTTSVPSVAPSLRLRVLDILTGVLARTTWHEATTGEGALELHLDDLPPAADPEEGETEGIDGDSFFTSGLGSGSRSSGFGLDLDVPADFGGGGSFGYSAGYSAGYGVSAAGGGSGRASFMAGRYGPGGTLGLPAGYTFLSPVLSPRNSPVASPVASPVPNRRRSCMLHHVPSSSSSSSSGVGAPSGGPAGYGVPFAALPAAVTRDGGSSMLGAHTRGARGISMMGVAGGGLEASKDDSAIVVGGGAFGRHGGLPPRGVSYGTDAYGERPPVAPNPSSSSLFASAPGATSRPSRGIAAIFPPPAGESPSVRGPAPRRSSPAHIAPPLPLTLVGPPQPLSRQRTPDSCEEDEPEPAHPAHGGGGQRHGLPAGLAPGFVLPPHLSTDRAQAAALAAFSSGPSGAALSCGAWGRGVDLFWSALGSLQELHDDKQAARGGGGVTADLFAAWGVSMRFDDEEEAVASLSSAGHAATEIALALSVLDGYVPLDDVGAVLTFLDRHVTPLLFHSAQAVRLEAALLTSQLLVPHDRPMILEGRAGLLASHLLSRLTSVAVGDPDEKMRIRILAGFGRRFLPALAQPSMVRALAATLHDASLTVRLVSVRLMGTLAEHNPAVVMPLLRKALLTLLSQLRSSTGMMHRATARRAHEEAATLLAAVERHAPVLARTYCLPILHALLPLLQADAPPLSASAATYTLAELIPIAGPLLDPYASELLELFLAAMRPAAAPTRRRSALTALERLVSCRGPAVLEPSPYERSSTLLPTLISHLSSDGDDASRISGLRVIGLLGALEPLQYRAAIAKAEEAAAMRDAASGGSRAPGGGDEAGAAMTNSAELPAAALAAGGGGGGGVGGGAGGGGAGVGTGATPLRQWGDDLSPTSAQYLPTIALRELLAILHDASLSAYHHRLIAAIVYIFTALGDTCAPLLPRVMPTLLAILLAGDTSMRPSTDGVAGGNAPSSVGATGGMPVVGVTSLSRPATTHVFNHLMQQLPVLVSAMHAHLQPWVPQLVELVRMHWHGPMLLQVITLLEQLTLLLREDLAPYASELIPSLGAVIDADTTAQRVPSLAALGALDGFGPLLREYTALLLPTILRLLEQVRSSSPPCAPRIAC